MLSSESTETHHYTYAGGKLLRETITETGKDKTVTTYTLDFRYDAQGVPYSLIVTTQGVSQTYYYITNLQGDVMYIVDESGDEVASYDYDPYGKLLRTTGDFAETNPIRYRGYYYDTDTDFYYLQSRYYDPTICRFINYDSYASTGQGLVGYNMFVYCGNNPVNCEDPDGYRPIWEKTYGGVTMYTDTALSAGGSSGTYGANTYNMMQFYGVNSPEEIPALPDGAMVFVESVTSVSPLPFVSCIRGRTIVMDNDKYCEYYFTGTGASVSAVPFDSVITGGYVYGVKEPGDYSGLFVGGSTNMLYYGNGGAVAPNGVYAEILGVYGQVGPGYGVSITGYTALSSSWIYGLAPIQWFERPQLPNPLTSGGNIVI